MAASSQQRRVIERRKAPRPDRRQTFEELESRLLMFAASMMEITEFGELCLTAAYDEHAQFDLDHDHDHFLALDHFLAQDHFGGFDHEQDHDHDHDLEVLGVLDHELTGGMDGGGEQFIATAYGTLPALHSNPSAAVKIYLDFDGHFESTWGAYSNVSTPVFDTNGNSAAYSSQEVTQIREIWERVAEDFSPFNVDVTTVDPGDFSNGKGIRVAIGGNGSWIGSYGGVAYVDSFTNSLSNTVHVFSANLANSARYIAEAASHEVGHALGLYHQSEYNASGTKLADYYAGTGNWAPIMGVGYYREQTTWHNGPNSHGPYSYQDDLAVITRALNGFGYRQDDYGSTLNSPSQVQFSNGLLGVSGVIEQVSDWDVFSFQMGSATSVTLDVDGAGIGANLDLQISLYNSGGQLVLSSNPADRFDVSVSAELAADDYRLVVRGGGDYGEVGQYSVRMQVVNSAPDLAPLSDVVMSHRANPLSIALSATDSDGDAISYSADIRYTDALEQLAYDLDQQYGLFVSGSDYFNQRGLQEKYLQGTGGQWFYMLPTGEVFQWGGSVAASTKIGTLDASFHTNLARLYNAQTPTSVPFAGTWQIAGNVLTIDPANGTSGTYTVKVTASDGYGSDIEQFTLQVVNAAPNLAAIADQTMKASDDSLSLQLSVSDSDGDSVTMTASALANDSVGAVAYQLKEQYGLFSAGSDYFNQRGLQEKYFQGAGDSWYFMLPDGATYAWAGSVAASPLVGQLDSSYFNDLTKLFNAENVANPLNDVAISVSGETLTIDPTAGFAGDFVVRVTASDGVSSTEREFLVSVTNQAPTLAAIADQTMAASQDTLVVALAAADQDGDIIQYTAETRGGDPIAQLAYQLDQEHGFYWSGSDYYNQRGLQEKYFQGNGGSWFYMLPDGAIYSWGGSVAASTHLGTLNSSYFQNLPTLFDAPEVNATVDEVALQFSGNSLIIDPEPGYTGEFEVIVRASDGVATTSDRFKVTITNHVPTITAIVDQTIAPSQDQLLINLAAHDADGDTVLFSAVAKGGDPVAVLAYQLDQEHAFYSDGSDYFNQRGLQEKYFLGNGGNWYYMLPTGAVYAWGGSVSASTLLGTLDSSYHASLTKLFNAPNVETTVSDVNLSISGSTLTIDPDPGFTGQFEVEVSATDGMGTATTTFTVSVVNRVPTITTIVDQSMAPSQDALTVNLTASDEDGDAIQFSAEAKGGDPIARLAYQLKQEHNLYFSGSDYYNQRGVQEKYFQGNGGNWYYMLPTGAVYSWGGSFGASTLLGTLDASYHSDLNKLFNAQPADTAVDGVTVSVVGNVLTIDPDAGFTGSFEVEVTATDGIATDSTRFTVSVFNRAPTIQQVADQGISPSVDSVVVNLSGADADGDALSWNAEVMPSDQVAAQAYQLRQQHGFYYAGSEYYNQRGLQEKYFQGNGGNWYFMLPDGSTYSWGGSVAASPLVGTLDNSYFNDLFKLFNAAPVSDPSSEVVVSLQGNQLTINPDAGYTGSFQIQVTATDGIATTTMSFTVEVENQAPTVATVADQTMTTAEDTRQIMLNVADADGDAVTVSAGITSTDSTALLAYQLKQQHGFRWGGSEYYNQRGLQEKYFLGNNDAWYFMYPDGSIYAWNGSVAASPLVGTLDNSYFADLTKLFHAPPVDDPSGQVSVQLQGNVLTVDPSPGYTGSFQVTVTATAGSHTTTRTIHFTVADAAPPIEASLAISTATADGADGVLADSLGQNSNGGMLAEYPPGFGVVGAVPSQPAASVLPSLRPLTVSTSASMLRRGVLDAAFGFGEQERSYGPPTTSGESSDHGFSSRFAPAVASRQAMNKPLAEEENLRPGDREALDAREVEALQRVIQEWESQRGLAVDELLDALEAALRLAAK